jgi:hypothetical protein
VTILAQPTAWDVSLAGGGAGTTVRSVKERGRVWERPVSLVRQHAMPSGELGPRCGCPDDADPGKHSAAASQPAQLLGSR